MAVTLVVYVEDGLVQWVRSNDLRVRVLVLDADISKPDAPIACWDEIPLSLTGMAERLQHLIRAYDADPLFPSSPHTITEFLNRP